MGLESTPEEYVETMRGVFAEVRRVLRADGTLWLNMGDGYAGSPAGQMTTSGPIEGGGFRTNKPFDTTKGTGLKPKDLIGMPWRLAFALQSDGWYLRSDIIWHKPNPMPESVTDRPTKAHEYLFLMSKSQKYYYDADAIREDAHRERFGNWKAGLGNPCPDRNDNNRQDMTPVQFRNRRSVWTIPTAPYPKAHFATFPPKLIEPCILAGCPDKCCVECGAPWVRVVEKTAYTPPVVDAGVRNVDASRQDKTRKLDGKSKAWREAAASATTTGFEPTCTCDTGTVPGVVLDPFLGSGTTAQVAKYNGRKCVGIELNEEYAALATKRLRQEVLF
jgi:DNA modification methylase